MSRAGPQVPPPELPLLLLTVAQAAAMCQVSTDRIYQWSYEEGFPAIKEPHQLRVHARLFQEWLEKRAALGRMEAEAPPVVEETAA